MRFMLDTTDEQHPATVAQIIEYLAGQDISAERKTVYDDLDTLRRFGVDIIQVHSGGSVGYYVAQRDFQLPELRLLVDAVQSSKFITHKKSLELIKKIEGLASCYDAKLLHRQVFVKNRIKTMNESIYYNVDEIQDAIENDRAISFKYYDYAITKERIFRHNGQNYIISPYALTWDDENYYMIGYDDASKIIKHFRVDKMSGISVLEDRRSGRDVLGNVDMSDYTETHFDMFSGSSATVRLKFENSLAGAVIDRFGKDVMLVPFDSEHFTVTVSVAVSPRFFGWLCGFGNRVQIVAPDSVVAEMGEFVRNISRLYN
jgi:predicted DNA-binding transcriptional regulator YafY